MGRGSGFSGGAAEVLALSFSFSNSLGGGGRVESRMQAEVPSISRLTADSKARVGGGVIAHRGEVTVLSGDGRSLAVSGRGEWIEEWVCGVTTTSLHKAKQKD